MDAITFPDHFRFGTATSSFQIEGAAGLRRECIWDELCRCPGAIADGSDGLVAVDHYHRYAEDVALMARLGMQVYRFSVSWPRVMFDDGSVDPAGLDFYSRLVDALGDAGIEPWLTLYHWDLPSRFPGGWTNRDTASAFVDYALAVHARLGDRVRIWTTLNEPWCSSYLSYAGGEHAPGHTDATEAFRAHHHLLLAHGWATRALRDADPTATLGITLNFTPVSPADPDAPADVDVARRIDATSHRGFTDPLFRGTYPADLLADAGAAWPADLVRDGDLAAIATPFDVLGVNYYTSMLVRAGEPSDAATAHPTAPDAVVVDRPEFGRTDMGEITPDALRELLLWLHTEYTGPAGVRLAITENGYAGDDPGRIAYLDAHLRALHAAREQGAAVDTYLQWSLIDNFEWAHGYAKRFGMVGVDANLDRLPKPSAEWFARVARSRTVPPPA